MKFEKRFAEQDLKFEQRFHEQDLKLELRIKGLDDKFESRFDRCERHFKLFQGVQAILVAAILLPQIGKFLG